MEMCATYGLEPATQIAGPDIEPIERYNLNMLVFVRTSEHFGGDFKALDASLDQSIALAVNAGMRLSKGGGRWQTTRSE